MKHLLVTTMRCQSTKKLHLIPKVLFSMDTNHMAIWLVMPTNNSLTHSIPLTILFDIFFFFFSLATLGHEFLI